MKAIIVATGIALIAWACTSMPEPMEFDITRSDSISEVGRKFITIQDTLYEKEYSHLLDDLHNLRDSNIEPIVEVQCVTDTIYEVKEVVQVVEVPIYKKIVYSINSPRAFQVSIDTCACTDY